MLRALDGEVDGVAPANAVSEPLPSGPAAAGDDGLPAVQPDVAFALLADNVGHLVVRCFESSQLLHQFATVFERISHTQGLVVDLRDCRGCGSANAWKLLSYLMDKPFNTVRCMSRSYVLVRRGYPAYSEDAVLSSAGVWSASVARPYHQPVVLLLGAGSGAAAKDFAATFDAAQRGVLRGGPGGDDPEPLPHGVQPSAGDTAAGRDTVLFAAWRSLVETSGRIQAG